MTTETITATVELPLDEAESLVANFRGEDVGYYNHPSNKAKVRTAQAFEAVLAERKAQQEQDKLVGAIAVVQNMGANVDGAVVKVVRRDGELFVCDFIRKAPGREGYTWVEGETVYLAASELNVIA